MNNHEIPPHGQINITLEDNHSDHLKETAYFIHPYRTPLGKNLYPYFFGSLHNCFYLSLKKKIKEAESINIYFLLFEEHGIQSFYEFLRIINC